MGIKKNTDVNETTAPEIKEAYEQTNIPEKIWQFTKL